MIYRTNNMGAHPLLSWLGVLVYSCASAFPAIIVATISPRIHDMKQEGGQEEEIISLPATLPGQDTEG